LNYKPGPTGMNLTKFMPANLMEALRENVTLPLPAGPNETEGTELDFGMNVT